MSQTIASLQQQLDSVSAIITTTLSTGLNFIRTQNSELSTTALYEENEQMVNEIYYQTIAEGDTDFSPEQIAQLENIIYQCPLAGGDAVFLARGLYMFVNDSITYNDGEICAQQGMNWRQIKNTYVSKKLCKVYPNPTSDKLTVEVVYNNTYPLQMKVIDILGKEISAYSLNSSINHLDVSMLASGVYYFKIINSQNISNSRWVKNNPFYE